VATQDNELDARGTKNLEESRQTGYDPGGEAEFHKLWADYLKHITTLSTGSILLIATFLEKLFSQPRWKAAVLTSLLGFLASVLGSTIGLSGVVIRSKKLVWTKAEDEIETNLMVAGTLAAWLGFLVGIVGLTAFTIRNLT
jgi:predicted permease